jgi:thioredoxin 2
MPTTDTPSTTIMCHQCGALNRAPAGRALSLGKCGKCSASLATPHPVEIDGAKLARLQARDQGAFVIDVWAPWCGPCRMMAPAYDSAATSFVDRARLFKLNSDENQPGAAGLGIRGIPTLIAYRGGRQVAHQSGAQTGPALNRWIEAAISST